MHQTHDSILYSNIISILQFSARSLSALIIQERLQDQDYYLNLPRLLASIIAANIGGGNGGLVVVSDGTGLEKEI